MSLQWCRLYGEMVDDAKLRLLAFEDRWHYVAILCCKTQGLLEATKPEMLDRVVGAKLGLATRELDEVRRRLWEVDLIDLVWQPKGWDKRQYKSDDVNSRVRNFRARLKEEETDTESDTDTEGKRCTQRPSNVSETFQAKPRPTKRCPVTWQPSPEDLSKIHTECPDIDYPLEERKFRDYEFGRAKSDWSATWRNWMREAQSRSLKRNAPALTKYERNRARMFATTATEATDNFLLTGPKP